MPDPETLNHEMSVATEKTEILRRLKAYRKEHGAGCLRAVSDKTAHLKKARLSEDKLRGLCSDNIPRMEISEWRKISKALDELAKETKILNV